MARRIPQFPITEGLTGAAIREKRTIVVDDVRTDARYLTAFGNTLPEMIIPVLGAKNRAVVGTIDVESEHTNAFSETGSQFTRSMCYSSLAALVTTVITH